MIKLHYQDTAVAAAYDRERFTSLAGRTLDRLEKRGLSSLIRRVRHEISDPTALDIPCGTGRITEHLLAQGLVVTGGDISNEMIAVAKEKCAKFGSRVQWRRMDLDDLSLEKSSVDLVSCIRLFHHLDSPARTRILVQLSHATRQFVIFNVCYSSPFYRLRRRLKRQLKQGVSRESSTSLEIQAELRAAGLKIEARRFVWPGVSEDLLLLCRKC